MRAKCISQPIRNLGSYKSRRNESDAERQESAAVHLCVGALLRLSEEEVRCLQSRNPVTKPLTDRFPITLRQSVAALQRGGLNG